MKPLIEIQTVPISLEFKVNSAKTERQTMNAEVEISRDQKGLTIASRPIRLRLDSYESRNSYLPSTTKSIEQFAQEGVSIAYEATARFAEEGNMMVNIHLDQDAITQIMQNRVSPDVPDFTVGFIPSTPVDMSWEPGELTIQYQMDKLNFDWKMGNNSEFKFIPASIEFSVKQYPTVTIKYVGEPIYVPPSSAPGYVPIDEKA